MTVFSAQTKLPSCTPEYLRLLGNLEMLGKWSPLVNLYNSNEIVDGVCYQDLSV